MYASAGGARPPPANRPVVSPMPIRSAFNLNGNPNPNYYPGILVDDLFPKDREPFYLHEDTEEGRNSRKGEPFYLHEETEEGRNSRKGEMEANNNQRAHLEQVEVANQFKSDEHAEHKFTSLPHAIDASIHADIVGEIGSSFLMPEAAPLSAILEALRRLSGNLLSPDFVSIKLKGHDHDLLRLLIDNIVAFAMRNKKDVNRRNAHDSRPIAGLNSDFGGKQKHDSCTRDEMIHSVTLEMLKEEVDLSYDHNSSDLCNHENVVKAEVYKKLWIKAEAALCIMKLQFAQIEINGESHNHQTEGNLQQSSEVSSPEDSMYYKHEAPIITKKKNPVAAEDASVQAGLKVLKDRDNIANSTAKNIELTPAKIAVDRVLTSGNLGAANSSDLELSEDTFYTDMNRSEINDSIGNNDEEKEGLDFFVSSSDEELDSCRKKPNSGDEGDGFSSDWELV
ncbi:uncharacterized protein LOC109821264 isoform X2 [Asparagus officinalis]|uniref:uncharacterized protein LOC109821264 isoform X2 n=1 Tax=Asparagus officinalis TaxID=4686 RepID=UPI00098E2D46|nr:uncharacterized protein LOC109821264 isoform X2 [Asparagus officinalis]